MKPQIFGAVVETVNGLRRLRYSVEWVRELLSKYADGERITVKMSDERPPRSERANSFYWVVLGIWSKDTGHTQDELHSLFKWQFLRERKSTVFVDPITKKKRRKTFTVCGSTTQLNSKEFSEYLQKCSDLCGLPIPPMDEFNDYR